MHQPEIAEGILSQLNLQDVKVLRYTLMCSGQTLRERIGEDVRAGVRGEGAVERSLSYLPLFDSQDTIKVMTDGLSPREIAEQIVEHGQDN